MKCIKIIRSAILRQHNSKKTFSTVLYTTEDKDRPNNKQMFIFTSTTLRIFLENVNF